MYVIYIVKENNEKSNSILAKREINIYRYRHVQKKVWKNIATLNY